ncbi:hypothetical protein [Magnetovibrio blakemorei]|uniref:Secreted protein n=1 Tax=Magnetovibrio blakemorei TaxID=28181 RepID=A0A1E5Q9C0_9PROT|nr:hypothetical protein [Magnetovibrio blakemorei]OEJ68096.1 hypothetical protein BEN30_07515 [Magnetovibrio blakemorei]
MKIILKLIVWPMVLMVLSAGALSSAANAMAINRCMRVLKDSAGRETVVNTCAPCMTVKVERQRPGQTMGTPSQREFNMPGGSSMPLPFLGPGTTRIMSEAPCPEAQ